MTGRLVLTRNVLLSVYLLAALVVIFLTLSPLKAGATTTPRFEQNIKDEQISPITMLYTQTLSCADLSGQIEDVTISLTPVNSSYIGYDMVFMKPGESLSSPKLALRTSEVSFTGPRYAQNDVTFTFPSPIDVDGELCDGVDAVSMRIKTTQSSSNAYTYINGASGDVYPGGYYSSGANDTDIYFIINGQAEVNHPPVLNPIGNQNGVEGQTLLFTASASDVDGDSTTLTASGLPPGASFDANTGVFSWTPDYENAGIYTLEVIAAEDTEEMLTDSEAVTITVGNMNRAPVMNPVGNQTVNEGQNLQFTVVADDPDGDLVALTATNIPDGSTFDSETGVFSWNTGYNDSGNYLDIEFAATDDGSPMELDVELITITVGNVNRAPVFDSTMGAQTVLENETLNFDVVAIDPDGDVVFLTANNVPVGASFDPVTGNFSWAPDNSQEGVYAVTFVATDDGVPIESSVLEVSITVGDVPTPVEQAEDIIDTVVGLGMLQSTENSYLANLQKVGTFIEDGKITPAINQLNAFLAKVENDLAQSEISQVEGNQLIIFAENLITDLTK